MQECIVSDRNGQHLAVAPGADLPCLHQQSSSVSWTILEKNIIWKSVSAEGKTFCLLILTRLDSWKAERAQTPSICLSGPGNNARMSRSWAKNLETLWLLNSKQTFHSYTSSRNILNFQNTIFQYFSLLSCPSSESLKIPHSKNYGFKCL